MPSNYPTPEQLRQETALLQRMARAGYAGIPTGGAMEPQLPAQAPLQTIAQAPGLNPAEQQEQTLRQLGIGPNAGYKSMKAPSIIPLNAVLSNGDHDYNVSAAPLAQGNKFRALNAEVSGPLAGGELALQGGAGRMFGKFKSPTEYEVGIKYTKGFADGGFVDGKSLEEPIDINTQQQINTMMSNGGLASTARPDLASFAKGGDVDVNDFQPPLQQQQPSAIDLLKNEFAKRGLDFNKFIASPPVMQQALANAQNMGIKGDTMLAHINEKEAKLLKEHGGSGDINPNTGLPMFADDTASSDFFRLYNPPAVNTSYGYGPQQLFYKYLEQKLRSPTTNPTATTNPLTATSSAVNYQPSAGGGGGESGGAQLAGGPETTQTNTTPGVSNLSSGAMTNISGVIGGLLGGAVAGPLGSIAGGLLGRSYGVDALSQALGMPSLSGYPSAPVGTPTPSARPGDLESLSTSKTTGPSITGPSLSAPSVSAPSVSAPSVDVAETEADVQAMEQAMGMVNANAPAAPEAPAEAPSTSSTTPGGAMGNTTSGGFGPGGITGGLAGANVSGGMAAAAAAAAAQEAAAQAAATNAANQSAAQNAANNAQTGFGGGIMGGTFGNQGDIGINADVSGKGQMSGPTAQEAAAATMANALADAMANAASAMGYGGFGNDSGFSGPGQRDSNNTDTTGQTGGNTTAGDNQGGGFGGPGFGGRDSSTADTTGTTGGNTTGEVSGGGFGGPGFGGRDSSTDTAGGGFGGPGFGGRDSSTSDTTGQTGGNTTAGDNASPGESGSGPESASVARGGFIAKSKPRSPLNAVAKKKHAKSPLKAMRKA